MTGDTDQKAEHWRLTKNLMVAHLIVWGLFAFVIHCFATTLNEISFMGFPLGFYMAAQGSLAVFVVQLFIFVRQQENIDRKCGMEE